MGELKNKKPQSIVKSNLSIFKDSAYPSITSTLFAATITCKFSSIEEFPVNSNGSVVTKFIRYLFLKSIVVLNSFSLGGISVDM